jgi:GGDEF domain-containing protein
MTEPGNTGDFLTYPVSTIVVRVDVAGAANNNLRETLFADVAAVVRQSLRSVDLLFRSGPNELVALLLKTDPDASAAIAGRLRTGLAEIQSQHRQDDCVIEGTVVASPLHQDAPSIQSFLNSFKVGTDAFRRAPLASKSDSVH